MVDHDWRVFVDEERARMAFDREEDRLQLMLEVYGVRCDCRSYPGLRSDPFASSDFRPLSLRRFAPRLVVAMTVFVFCSYTNNLAQAWLQSHMAGYYDQEWIRRKDIQTPTQRSHTRLWDVSFHYLPHLKSTTAADVVAIGASVIVGIRFVIVPGPLSLRWAFVNRFLIVSAILYLLRGISIILTPLPNPDETCVPNITYPNNIWLEAWAILFFPDDVTCLDVMFSGHTIALTTSMLFLNAYIARSPWFLQNAVDKHLSFQFFLNWVTVIVLLVGYYCIVASRFHYSVDIYIGSILSCLVFHVYHYSINLCWYKSPKHLSIWPLLRWFELHSKDMRLHVVIGSKRPMHPVCIPYDDAPATASPSVC
eukprot:TRINITY_DN46957_c0_g1_i1.p1 TRINITY_DN46957_c0_g1~~TRINITY_DN46957_c0_g1_i1.p1  ORF type:complete len:366 (-),score=15.39 TRINITY_DN46957_c0_g1_i1:8-1105(-)